MGIIEQEMQVPPGKFELLTDIYTCALLQTHGSVLRLQHSK